MYYAGIVSSEDELEYEATGSVMSNCVAFENYFDICFLWEELVDGINYDPNVSYSLYIAREDQALGCIEYGVWDKTNRPKYRVCLRRYGTAYALSYVNGHFVISDNKYTKILEIMSVAQDLPKYVVVQEDFGPVKKPKDVAYAIELGNDLTRILSYIPYCGNSAKIALLTNKDIGVISVSTTADGELGVTNQCVTDKDVTLVCDIKWNKATEVYEYSGVPWFEYISTAMEVTDE